LFFFLALDLFQHHHLVLQVKRGREGGRGGRDRDGGKGREIRNQSCLVGMKEGGREGGREGGEGEGWQISEEGR